MNPELAEAYRMRIIGVLSYLAVLIVGLLFWFFVVVLSNRTYSLFITPLFVVALVIGIATSFAAYKVMCPKCSGHFFVKSKSSFWISPFITRCRHCHLHL